MDTPTYTAEQLERRDNSKWTTVQVVLAPLQFLAFIISFALVIRYLVTGSGYTVATVSVLVKITLLWAITITGMFWEKDVFDKWFLAPQFFWEDFMNAVAMLLHNLYFLAQWAGWSERSIMTLMLVAYSSYLVNCMQFFIRGIKARQQREAPVAEVA